MNTDSLIWQHGPLQRPHWTWCYRLGGEVLSVPPPLIQHSTGSVFTQSWDVMGYVEAAISDTLEQAPGSLSPIIDTVLASGGRDG